MQLTYKPQAHWPTLAWLAECSIESPEILVHHGPRVEARPEWFCEAVWDGDFEEGGFDRTDLVFGSGCRLRPDSAVFVSSASTVDRLQYLQQGDRVLVSNSLACLKSVTTGWPSREFRNYRKFFSSITRGIDGYERTVPGGGPTLVYYRNLAWDGRDLRLTDKPSPPRRFDSFEAYVGFLRDSLVRIGANTRSPRRRFELGLMGTASSGYDSPAIAALARPAGLEEVVSFATAREGRSDDAREIAERLGLRVTILDRQAWRSAPTAEVPFIAGDARGGDIFYAGAEEKLKYRVLLTGYQGGKIWAKKPMTPEDAFTRLDMSGLSFTEFRLTLGTIHFPVAFMGIRNVQEISELSSSEEMEPWDAGGGYSNPICRRVLEEAGVPGHLFGQVKKATANLFDLGDVCVRHSVRSDYALWRKSLAEDGPSNAIGGLPGVPLVARWYVPEIWFHAERLMRQALRVLPERVRDGAGWRLTHARFWLNKRANYFVPWAFPWALERLAEKYRPR